MRPSPALCMLVTAVVAGCGGDPPAPQSAAAPPAPIAARDDSADLARLERQAADPRDVEARALLATSLARRGALSGDEGFLRRAETIAREALVRDPAHETALSALADALVAMQRESDAAAICADALAHRPGSDAVLASHFGALFAAGRIDEAGRIGDRLIGRAPSSRALAACARLADARGRLDDALRHAQLAAETAGRECAPDSDVAALHSLVARLHLELGAGGEAMAAAARATSACAGSSDAWRTAAAVHSALGRRADAVSAAERAVEARRDARTLLALSDARRRAGDAAGAAEALSEARDAAESAGARRPEDLAAVLEASGGDDDRALDLATRAALARPRPDNRILRARLLHRTGRLPDACAEILELGRVGHRSAEFLLAAARILWDGHHRTEARAALADLAARGAVHRTVEALALELEFADGEAAPAPLR